MVARRSRGCAQVTAAAVAALRETDPALEVTYRDLADEPLVHLTPAALPNDHPLAALATAHDPAAQAVSARVLEEFVAADVVVLGVPMYNFAIPSQVKGWFDRLPVPGKTFTYGEQGAVGLAGAKRVIIALSRGGFYGTGMPKAKKDHVEPVLRSVFGSAVVASRREETTRRWWVASRLYVRRCARLFARRIGG